MIVEIVMKTPDAVDFSIERWLDNAGYMEDLNTNSIVENEMLEDARHTIKEDFMEVANKYFEYGEFVTLLLDTETGTCTVKEL